MNDIVSAKAWELLYSAVTMAVKEYAASGGSDRISVFMLEMMDDSYERAKKLLMQGVGD